MIHRGEIDFSWGSGQQLHLAWKILFHWHEDNCALYSKLLQAIYFIKLNYNTNLQISENEIKSSVGLLKHEIKLAPWSSIWVCNS